MNANGSGHFGKMNFVWKDSAWIKECSIGRARRGRVVESE